MARREKLLDVAKQYIKERCNSKGEILDSNYSDQEKRGVKKLKKRIKEREIVVRPTDKSHKLCVCSWDNYVEQGKVHVGKDRKVNWSEISEMQKICNVTARALTKIFKIGEGTGTERG